MDRSHWYGWLAGILVLSAWSSAGAQVPGTVIEVDGTQSRNRALLKQAAALREAGELMSEETLRSQLAAPTPSAIAFPSPNRRKLTPRQVADVARKAMVRVGWYGRRGEKGRWEIHVAGGYVVTGDGVVATCHHCIQPMKGLHEASLVAVDHTGTVRAVTAILTDNKTLDASLVRIAGEPLKPLPLSDNVAVGDAAFCFSDPFDQHGYFSEGIINRFYWLKKKRGEPNTLGELQFLRINVSTDWAPGSSGAAVLDAYGNAIGHVARISPLTLDGPAQIEAEDAPSDEAPDMPRPKRPRETTASSETTLMVVHEAVPARGILAMAGAWSPEKVGTSSTVKAEPSTPSAFQPEKPAEPTLDIGMAAPPLKVSKWLQGDAIEKFDPEHAYIVEFWATWCGPCRTSIPHLNELHEKFADQGLIVIGQDCWERDDDLVEPFVKEMGDKMTYRIAFDDKSDDKKGAMASTWMDAAGQSGIPTAFIVDKQQKIAWIGHPMDLSEEMLSAVLKGTFDVEQAKRDRVEQQKFLEMARGVMREISAAVRAKEWDKAESLVDKLEDAAPAKYKTTSQLQRLNIAVVKKDAAAINRVAASLGERDDATGPQLNQLAWQMALLKDVDGLDLELAERLARKGVEKSEEGQKGAVLDTLARVLFRQDKKEEAIAVQKEAIEHSDGVQREGLKKTLESYEKGELPDAE